MVMSIWSKLPGVGYTGPSEIDFSDNDTFPDSLATRDYSYVEDASTKLAKAIYIHVQERIEKLNGITDDQIFALNFELYVKEQIESGALPVNELLELSEEKISAVLNRPLTATPDIGYLEKLNNQINDYIASGKSDQEINQYITELSLDLPVKLPYVESPSVSAHLFDKVDEYREKVTILAADFVAELSSYTSPHGTEKKQAHIQFSNALDELETERFLSGGICPSDLVDYEILEPIFFERLTLYRKEKEEKKAYIINYLKKYIYDKLITTIFYERPVGTG